VVSTLSDLVSAHTDLTGADIDRLHSLVADWAMLADLSFADLLLCVRVKDPASEEYLVVAQVRPATGPTIYAEDMVAQTLRRWTLSTAVREGRIVREGDPEWERGVPVRVEAVPVRSHGRVIAVLARDTNLSATRSPSALELAYLRTAGDLVQMVSEGTFTFEAGFADSAEAPRVGDGMIRLDGEGLISYASPNAVSAYRRLGHNGNLVGEQLAEVHRQLVGAAGGGATAPSAAAEIPPGLRFREAVRRRVPTDDEIERAGTIVLLRAIPLMPGAERGTLVLVRDSTELRRREAQLLSKDATIREIHHRVKNNLQTVAALLRLQARRMIVPEARVALRESVRRVTSIALVHETLSQSMGEEVDFDVVADQLAAMTVDVAATASRATVERQGGFGILPGTMATPLALVLSELMQNAVEHGAAGAIRLSVNRRGNQLDLVVADDGAGLPADFNLEKAQGLGLQIVRTLVVGEMRGTLALRPGTQGGTEAAVAIPEIQKAVE
jgi:two-component sensor histidine kinase